MTIEELRQKTQARNQPAVSKQERQELAGKKLKLYRAVSHDVTITDDRTGEVTQAVRTLFEIEPGKFVDFVSSEAAAFVHLLAEYDASLDFGGKLEWMFKEVPTRRGRRTYSFVVL